MPRIGTPASKTACGARGLPSAVTEAGPPERITPFGCSRAKASAAFWNGMDLAIDAGLAHAARDQLRHLAAEIDDEDGVGMCGVLHGGRLKKRVSRRNGLRERSSRLIHAAHGAIPASSGR